MRLFRVGCRAAALVLILLALQADPAEARRFSREAVGAAARSLGVEPCALMAVLQVESGGSGFLPCGKPRIVFEGHVFWKRLKARGKDPAAYRRDNPGILFPRWTKRHYRGGEGEYERLGQAMTIDRDAALDATLWGAFQVLGVNHKLCGYADIDGFAKAQETPEGQLRVFVRYLKARNLAKPLREKNWKRFARLYNGPGYASHNYHGKLAAAYSRCAARARR